MNTKTQIPFQIALIATFIGISFCSPTRADSFFNLQVGTGNSQTDKSLSVGTYNALSSSSDAFAVGTSNYGYLYNSSVIGSLNIVTDTTDSGVFGRLNYVDGTYQSIVIGSNNDVGGLAGGAVIGYGLISNGQEGSLAIGHYGASGMGEVFTIGNGYIIPETNIDPETVVFHNALSFWEDGTMNFFGSTATSPTIVINPNIPSITIGGNLVLLAGTGNRAFGDSIVLSSPWKGAQAIGNSGYEKVVLGPLNSSYTGATIAGHNSALNGWANLNVAGQNLIFRTNGESESARISANGNFGIGTSAPGSKLHVKNGNITVENGDIGIGVNRKLILSYDDDPFAYITTDYANALGYGGGAMVFGSAYTNFAFINGEEGSLAMLLKEGKMGLLTASPSSTLTVARSTTPTALVGKSMIDWQYEQGGDATVYYTKLADIGGNNGEVQIEGLLGAHTYSQGKSTVNLLVSEREIPIRTGTVVGNIGNSDITVYKNVDGSSCVYLVTAAWSEVNLRITGASGAVNLVASPARTAIQPGGVLAYSLKQNAQFVFGNDGAVKFAKRQGDIMMGEFGTPNSGD